MTADRLVQGALAMALSFCAYFLQDAHAQLRTQQAALVDIKVTQASFVTRDMLERTVREMRDDVAGQIKQLRDDLPVIVRAAVQRQEQRR